MALGQASDGLGPNLTSKGSTLKSRLVGGVSRSRGMLIARCLIADPSKVETLLGRVKTFGFRTGSPVVLPRVPSRAPVRQSLTEPQHYRMLGGQQEHALNLWNGTACVLRIRT